MDCGNVVVMRRFHIPAIFSFDPRYHKKLSISHMTWVETVYFRHFGANSLFVQTFVTLGGKYWNYDKLGSGV